MNNHKRNFFILGTLFGVFLCVFIIVTYLNLPSGGNAPKELSVSQATSIIRDGKIKEARFTVSQVNLIQIDGTQFFTAIGSDATRELLLREIIETNLHIKKPITVREEPQSSGMFLIIMINALPFVILAFCLIFSLYWFLSSKSEQIK